MIALAFGILGAFLGIFRREVGEFLTIVAVAVIRRRKSFLDRLLPARRLHGYSTNLR